MTAPPPLSVPLPCCSRHMDEGLPMKSLSNSDFARPATARRWFSGLLRAAFPAASEAALALRAAPVLGVSERQVRNWLRCAHDASLRHVTAVVLIAGAEVALRRLEGAR